MTPEQKAVAKERGSKALKEMRLFGFSGKKTSIVIKRLLKSLDHNWDLIEAENYSTLVDAIISFEEPEEQPLGRMMDDGEVDDDNGAIVPAEAPLRRKRHTANQEEQHSATEIVLKKPKLEVDTLPENNVRHKPHDGLENGTRVSTDLGSPKASSASEASEPVCAIANAKGKGILIESMHGQPDLTLAHRRGKAPMNGTIQPLVVFKEPKVEPDTEPISIEAAVNDAPYFAGHPLTSEAPMADNSLPCSSIPAEGHPNSHQRSYGGDGCHFSGDNRKLDSVSDKTTVAEHAISTTNPSSVEIELASSVNSNVKLLLSWEETDDDFQMPTVDSILKLVEDKYLQSENNIPPEFSLKDILTEVCQIFSEAGKSGDMGPGGCM